MQRVGVEGKGVNFDAAGNDLRRDPASHGATSDTETQIRSSKLGDKRPPGRLKHLRSVRPPLPRLHVGKLDSDGRMPCLREPHAEEPSEWVMDVRACAWRVGDTPSGGLAIGLHSYRGDDDIFGDGHLEACLPHSSASRNSGVPATASSPDRTATPSIRPRPSSRRSRFLHSRPALSARSS